MVVCIVHGSIAVVAVNRPLALSRSSRGDGRLAGAECKLTLDKATGSGEASEEIGTVCGECTRQRGLVWDESVLRGTSLAELEDTAADGATIKGGGIAWGGHRRADDDWLRSLLGRHDRRGVLLCGCLLLGLLPCEIGSDGGLESELGLGLCGTNEGLEDLRVGGFEDDVAASGVGEALEDSLLFGLDVQAVAKL